jgi:hypothetical protein
MDRGLRPNFLPFAGPRCLSPQSGRVRGPATVRKPGGDPASNPASDTSATRTLFDYLRDYALDDYPRIWCMSNHEPTTHAFTLCFSFAFRCTRVFAELLGQRHANSDRLRGFFEQWGKRWRGRQCHRRRHGGQRWVRDRRHGGQWRKFDWRHGGQWRKSGMYAGQHGFLLYGTCGHGNRWRLQSGQKNVSRRWDLGAVHG